MNKELYTVGKTLPPLTEKDFPPPVPLPDEVADLREVAEKYFADFRIVPSGDTSYGGTVTLYATCRRCDEGLGFCADSLWEALCSMLSTAQTGCDTDRHAEKRMQRCR